MLHICLCKLYGTFCIQNLQHNLLSNLWLENQEHCRKKCCCPIRNCFVVTNSNCECKWQGQSSTWQGVSVLFKCRAHVSVCVWLWVTTWLFWCYCSFTAPIEWVSGGKRKSIWHFERVQGRSILPTSLDMLQIFPVLSRRTVAHMRVYSTSIQQLMWTLVTGGINIDADTIGVLYQFDVYMQRGLEKEERFTISAVCFHF